MDSRDIVDNPKPTAPVNRDALLVLLPLLIILSSLLFLLLLFLVCVIFLRRRRGISLGDNDGPIDMNREELIDGEGGFEGVEERWLETVDDETQRAYRRAKDYQTQYPPNSLPTDITLSQFLSIQEKGVSAWSFEPDYESNASILVHSRTELTFLPDPFSSSCVQSNLPLPKLNEVYYWEVKLFDLPETTSVAIGLATKPYPVFRLPGYNRFSVAYHSNGDKSHNYPFTAQSYGSPLKEGDVLGVGYRPRTGTVFFTRNGRKMDDAYIGLTRWNLFPTVGADGPCSLHVNLGQSGFVFIEANVKKWGLAPSVGTLAPPPAYGSERGSILLEAGGGIRPVDDSAASPAPNMASPSSSRRGHRSRRPRPSSLPQSSPLRNSSLPVQAPQTPPPPITPIEEEGPGGGPSSGRYISPTDTPFHTPASTNLPASPPGQSDADDSEQSSATASPSRSRSMSPVSRFTVRSPGHSRNASAAEMVMRLQPPPESPMNFPEPSSPSGAADIHLRALTPMSSQTGAGGQTRAGPDDGTARPPPAYSPLDALRYPEGVEVDLPAEVIAAALNRESIPESAVGMGQGDRHRSRRERRR
ncbi:SPRY-domain-containing protein [Fomitiporia mediterranea MF3/22]|uniref:SPRY-domain-containing protein n=1 Tax=Fomitiporia mediterranea (strain MF3/22) TaxID=694068 RepID=UPI00044093D8|nr:SPRY-domain-containing protein [Fomitiporia mediterranea MF3/22]EJD04047.1 SPRY-domain-containing protein [Fomitiporia mediterranea MF3/22]